MARTKIQCQEHDAKEELVVIEGVQHYS
jgi:hypothetical protein